MDGSPPTDETSARPLQGPHRPRIAEVRAAAPRPATHRGRPGSDAAGRGRRPAQPRRRAPVAAGREPAALPVVPRQRPLGSGRPSQPQRRLGQRAGRRSGRPATRRHAAPGRLHLHGRPVPAGRPPPTPRAASCAASSAPCRRRGRFAGAAPAGVVSGPTLAAPVRRRYHDGMATAAVLDREEYIEQAYFFRVLRDRLADGMATQEVLERIDQEILSTTRLPYAIQFLAAELKHTGLLVVRLRPAAALLHAVSGVRRSAAPRRSAPLPAGLGPAGAAARGGVPRRPAAAAGPVRLPVRGAVAQPPRLRRRPARRWRPTRSTTATGRRSSTTCGGRWGWWTSPTSSFCGPNCMCRSGGGGSRTTSRRCRRCSARRRARSPAPTAAATRSTCSRPCNGTSTTRRRRGRSRATTSATRSQVLEARLRELEKRVKLMESEMRGQIDLSQFGKPEICSPTSRGINVSPQSTQSAETEQAEQDAWHQPCLLSAFCVSR